MDQHNIFGIAGAAMRPTRFRGRIAWANALSSEIDATWNSPEYEGRRA